jgi:hypothetical protein
MRDCDANFVWVILQTFPKRFRQWHGVYKRDDLRAPRSHARPGSLSYQRAGFGFKC